MPLSETADSSLDRLAFRWVHAPVGAARRAKRVNLRGTCRDDGSRFADRSITIGRGPCEQVGGRGSMDAIGRVGGSAAPVAQPRGEFAIIDGAPPEHELREPR